jgi:hypothetical protein
MDPLKEIFYARLDGENRDNSHSTKNFRENNVVLLILRSSAKRLAAARIRPAALFWGVQILSAR